MFKKILVATDGSENSMRVAEVGRDMASKMGAEVTLVYAAHIPEMYSVDINPEVREALHEDGRKILEATARVFEGSGVKPHQRLLFDERPDEGILRLVSEEGYDLVILGSRGLHAKERRALGSTSMRVLEGTDRPVLVVH